MMDTEQAFLDELQQWPSPFLFDLARNPSTRPEIRKAAVEELIDRDDRRAFDIEINEIAKQIFDERAKPASKVKEATDSDGLSLEQWTQSLNKLEEEQKELDIPDILQE
jgi:hypothetical protein